MAGANGRSVQVVLTTGPQAAARARLGLDAALAAVASGLEVAVFLTLEATAWACEPRRVDDEAGVYDLIDQVRELGASVSCCSACATEQCGTDPGSSRQGGAAAQCGTTAVAVATTPGIDLVGLATLMERVASGVPTVTF